MEIIGVLVVLAVGWLLVDSFRQQAEMKKPATKADLRPIRADVQRLDANLRSHGHDSSDVESAVRGLRRDIAQIGLRLDAIEDRLREDTRW